MAQIFPKSMQPALFGREDESSDAEFYTQPRFLTHIDDMAIAGLTGPTLLDLSSSGF